MSDARRTYDVVLWGATGFTGRLVAEQFAERDDAADLAWAIAGRNRKKLETLRDDLAAGNPDCESLDVLVGDAFDRPRLGEIAAQTRVVCATVGPYATYGTNVVDACVEAGTHYCDLSGEVHWIREIIDEYHEAARDRGVRIVHSCGFDSIPSDLGTLLVQTYATETFGTGCSSVETFVSSSSFGISGGTVASMLEQFEAASGNPEVRAILDDPRSLTPREDAVPVPGRRRWGPRYDEAVGQWTAPFLMETVNEKTVHRSNALLGYPGSRGFRYRELAPTGSGPLGAVRAAGLAGQLVLTNRLMSVSPIRRLADRYVLPDPGDGPSRDTIEETSFEIRLRGTGPSPDSNEPFAVEGTITGDRDPGYGATAWMLSAAAICLATGDVDSPFDGGVLTPAAGIGTPLIDRLDDGQMTFSVGEPSS